MTASQSFSAEEVEWLALLLNKIRKGEQVDRILLRSPACAAVMRKTLAMKDRIAFLRAGGKDG